MRNLALALAATAFFSAAGFAQDAPALAHYTTAETTLGTLLDDPSAKAVLEKAMPGISTNPQIDMARSMTLKMIQQFAPDQFTDTKLAEIDAGLTQLPAK
jgi:para-nitrobenzyl esterase